MVVSVVMLYFTYERFETTLVRRNRFDIQESLAQRSLVRSWTPPAHEFSESIIVKELISAGRIYPIEDDKFAMDLVLADEFSRFYIDENEIRKILHRGNLYSHWDGFTEKSEVDAVIIAGPPNDGEYLHVLLRAPEYISSKKILEFRIRRDADRELPEKLAELTRSKIEKEDFLEMQINSSTLFFAP